MDPNSFNNHNGYFSEQCYLKIEEPDDLDTNHLISVSPQYENNDLDNSTILNLPVTLFSKGTIPMYGQTNLIAFLPGENDTMTDMCSSLNSPHWSDFQVKKEDYYELNNSPMLVFSKEEQGQEEGEGETQNSEEEDNVGNNLIEFDENFFVENSGRLSATSEIDMSGIEVIEVSENELSESTEIEKNCNGGESTEYIQNSSEPICKLAEKTEDAINNCVVANLVSMYQCRICEFTCQSPDNFLDHYKTHSHTKNSSQPKVKIENEPILVQPPQKETKDAKEATNESKEMFLCGQCCAVFETMLLCKEHMIKDHHFREIENSTKSQLPIGETIPNELKGRKISKDTDLAVRDEWLRPIPLKHLKAKLMKNFIHKCTIKGCLYKFENLEKRDTHVKCHLSSEKVRDFKCLECSMEHKCWRSCGIHMWKEHKIDIDLLKCPLCPYKIQNAVKIFRHLQIHGTTKGFACTVCSKTFNQFSQLRYHATTHLDKKTAATNRWYSQKTCEICGRLFANSKTLSKHVKSVHNKIKPFICNVCGHKSARKSTSLIHLRSHTGEKPYKCYTCSFMARDPSVMRKHKMRHTQTQPYKCKLCDYKAIQTVPFKTHIKTNHPEEYEKMKCDLCSFISVNSEILMRHKIDHKSGLIRNEDSSEAIDNSTGKFKRQKSIPEKPNEISSDCFLPLESTDSIAHDPPLDTGGVTIPAHSEDTQFPSFMNN